MSSPEHIVNLPDLATGVPDPPGSFSPSVTHPFIPLVKPDLIIGPPDHTAGAPDPQYQLILANV